MAENSKDNVFESGGRTGREARGGETRSGEMRGGEAPGRTTGGTQRPDVGSGAPLRPRPTVLRNPVTIIVLVVLFALGVFHWTWFINYGDVTFRMHDWGQEHVYYSVIRQGINTGSIPFHMSKRFHQTDRFMSIPDTNFMPWVLLLPAMSVGDFILLDLIILYTLGFAGCLLLLRKYGLSLLAFAFFFLVFNFNGHIVAHISVGHTAWSGYFLLPFFFYFLFEMLEGRSTRITPLKIAFILFAMMLKGSFHLYTWCIMFLVLLFIFNWKHARTVLFAIAASVLMSLFKVLPAAYSLLGREEKFIWSYPTIRDLLDAMITIRLETPERWQFWGNAGWWEFDIYVGLAGLAVLLYFGILVRFSRSDDLKDLQYGAMDLPVFVMTLLSLSYFHAFLTRIPFALLRSERVATRFILLPVITLALLSSLRLNRLLRRGGHSLRVLVIGIGTLAVMALAFLDHSFLWSVRHLEQVAQLKGVPPVPGLITREDPGYKLIVVVSIAVTIASLIALAYMMLRPRLRKTG